MDDAVKNIWKGQFESALAALTSFSKWLMILNLSVLLTYVTQYFQWTKQKAQLVKDAGILDKPWQPLQSFYEESRDSLPVYDQQVAEPWNRLCFVSWWGAHVLHDSPSLAPGCVTQVGDALAPVNFARKALSNYCSDLTRIIAAQDNGIAFADLSKDQLTSIINLIDFTHLHAADSLHLGLKAVVRLTRVFRDTSCRTVPSLGKPASPLFLQILSYVDRDSVFFDFIAQSGLAIRDFKTFGQEDLADSVEIVQAYLDSSVFQSLGAIEADRNKSIENIKTFQSGGSIGIPLTSISISLTQFVTVAGIINLCIILYFVVLYRRAIGVWKRLAAGAGGDSAGLAEAYFHNWTWGIGGYRLFTICWSLFLAFISVISLLFSFMIYAISERRFHGSDLVSICVFTIANVVVAVVVSRRYWRAGKGRGE